MRVHVGDTVGTYKVLAELGRGGMGEVFQVEHLITQRIEALKVIALDSLESPEANQRFLREIQLQASLEHPNIVSVHNAFEQDGYTCLIMELVNGHSLRTLLARGPLPLETCISYASQALGALTHAHEHGIIHRDISPANMVVTADGTLKMLDFGLARASADLCLTPSGAVIGSLFYVAPEQVTGRSPVDSRSDLYSLGAVLYEMVTGVKPFTGDSAFHLMLAQVSHTPAAPIEMASGVPLKLNEVILKALERDPNRRFQSAKSFRDELSSIGSIYGPNSDLNTKAGTPSVYEPPTATPRVKRTRIAAALVLITAFSGPWGHRASGPVTAVTKSEADPVVRIPAESTETALAGTSVKATTPKRVRSSFRPDPKTPDPKTNDKKDTGNRFSRLMRRIRHPHAAAAQDDPPLKQQP